MALNMDYGLRRPSLDELHSAFGTYRKALNATQGNIPLICFLMANPDRIASSEPEADPDDAEFRRKIAEAADLEDVRTAWRQQGEKKTIAEVMRQTGMGREKTRRILESLGLLSAKEPQAA